MDKNTIYGLILMALIFFGFMWLTPTQEPQKAATVQEETQVAQTDVATADSLTASEHEWLVNNIATNGVATTSESGKRSYHYINDGLDLTLTGDSIDGTITIDNKAYAWSDIVNNNPAVPLATQREAIEKIRHTSTTLGKYGKFASFLKGEEKTLKMENDVLALEFSSKSGSITNARLKKYDSEYNPQETDRSRHPVVIFDRKTNGFDFELPLPQPISTSELYFTPRQINDTTILMALEFEGGAYWGLQYTLPKGDSYVVDIKVVQKGMAPIAQSNNRTMGIVWNQDIKRQEKGRMFEEKNSGLYYKYAGGSVENLSESNNDKEERQAKIRWIAFKNQFFSTVLIADKAFNMSDFTSEILTAPGFLKRVSATAETNDYDWKAENPASFHLYAGPNLYPLLASLDDKIVSDEDLHLTRLIPLGWSLFRWINTGVIIPIFNFLGNWISNYGIVILLLTLIIKLVLFPLTFKSFKSQAKMRVLAPDIKAINDKYPGNENAMVRQQKTMALYSKAGASPFSGCLPLLLQMPILFAMFTFFPSCIELRGESFLWAHDLSAPDAIVSWNANIPLITAYFGNHISLFCLLMTATNIIYTYINTQSQPTQMPGMKWMMYLMPVFFMVFFNNYAAGLSYYYFLTLLITIIQTYAFRYFIKDEDVRREMAENAKKPRKKSGFMTRLEEAQRQQQAMLREQQKRNKR